MDCNVCLVLISRTLEFANAAARSSIIIRSSQPAFNPGIMPITSPRRVGPYNLESLPYVPAAMSASMKRTGNRWQDLLDVNNLQVLLDLRRHILDILFVLRG